MNVTKKQVEMMVETVRLLIALGEGALADEVQTVINRARVATVRAPDYEPEWED